MIPFLIFKPLDIEKHVPHFYFITMRVLTLFPNLEENLNYLDIRNSHAYILSALLSSFFISSFLFVFLFLISPFIDILLLFISSLFVFAFFFFFYIFFPSLRVKTLTLKLEQDLLFALRDMYIQVKSGISLFRTIQNIALSKYGEVSKQFLIILKNISIGMPEAQAFREVALKTKSEYFRRFLWQLTNAYQHGSPLSFIIKNILIDIENYENKLIREYISTLNFMSFLYLLIGAALPTIGFIFLIVLGMFGGVGVNRDLLIVFFVSIILIQFALLGYLNAARPRINE